MSVYSRLAELEKIGNRIRVGANGAGWMGSGFLAAMSQVPGMTVAAVCDEDLGLCRRAVIELGGVDPADVVVTDNLDEANRAVNQGKTVVTGSQDLLCSIDALDVITDVTPSPASGIAVAEKAFRNKKDVVLINIEADVTAGAMLRKKAAEAGVLYSVSSGDEPGCLMELWDFVQCLGYEPIVIGKGKNNPLNIDANPDTVKESAAKANKDPFQVASYVDGTKTMFELCCVSNATGYAPIRPGMVGPEADLSNVSEVFKLEKDGGIVPRPGAVDYVQGSEMSGGVFITVKVDNRRIIEGLEYLMVGKGPYFTFFRPYHLWFLEAPISIAQAVLEKKVTLASRDVPVSDVISIAKKDLSDGETLDDFGGYTFRGEIVSSGFSLEKRALPAGLAPGAVIKGSVRKGEIITWENVLVDETSAAVRFRKEQESMVRKNQS